jgi:hypothetical protein
MPGIPFPRSSECYRGSAGPRFPESSNDRLRFAERGEFVRKREFRGREGISFEGSANRLAPRLGSRVVCASRYELHQPGHTMERQPAPVLRDGGGGCFRAALGSRRCLIGCCFHGSKLTVCKCGM